MDQKQITALVEGGKPFIVGRYMGAKVETMNCKVKGSQTLKEERVIEKHTVINANGIHVVSVWHPSGTKKDAVKPTAFKLETPVIVSLWSFKRDGVGFDCGGEMTPVTG